LLKNSALIISADPAQAELEDVVGVGAQVELRELTVDPAHHGERLDKCLVGAIAEFSRSYLQQLIAQGAVDVNGAVCVKASNRLKAGDKCRIALRATPQSRAFKPQAMPLQIVFQDRHLLVVDKPAGLVVHPAPGNWSGTLLNGLLAYDAAFADVPRAGIVHRLDKDTSGLMLVARTRPVMDTLIQMIAARSVQRQYIALAHRPWAGCATREVASPIGRDPKNRLRMAVVDLARHSGKAARTSVELLRNGETACLVRCTLHTGRTHQIRVHMASIGHALVADSTYGGVADAGMHRQALHAFHLALAHPVSGQPLDFQSPLPGDLRAALGYWGFSLPG
jgi:23S rRNA pseudouridine1911/1915/1917 synthase